MGVLHSFLLGGGGTCERRNERVVAAIHRDANPWATRYDDGGNGGGRRPGGTLPVVNLNVFDSAQDLDDSVVKALQFTNNTTFTGNSTARGGAVADHASQHTQRRET